MARARGAIPPTLPEASDSFLFSIKINQFHSQPVILSLSNFHRVKNEVKAQNAKAVCGISFKISVACLLDVTFIAESHPNLLRDPIVAHAPRFCLFAKAQPAKLRLRSAVGHAALRSG